MEAIQGCTALIWMSVEIVSKRILTERKLVDKQTTWGAYFAYKLQKFYRSSDFPIIKVSDFITVCHRQDKGSCQAGQVEQCLEKAMVLEECYELMKVSFKVIRVRQHLSEESMRFRF
jgi:hypothetical protein